MNTLYKSSIMVIVIQPTGSVVLIPVTAVSNVTRLE
jgi:hypothetical protein